MSKAALMVPAVDVSPRFKARIAGILYLISGTLFTFAQNSVRGKLVVLGDAATTARNILAHEGLYRLGFAAELLPLYFIVTIILYDLLKPVNKSISLLAAVFSLVGCTIGVLTALLHFIPLVILRDSHFFASFTSDQLQSLALMSLRFGTETTNTMMVFFGFYCILIGYLIFRSKFLPRIIGIFLMLAGSAYQIDCFAKFLLLPFSDYSFRYVAFPAGILGEGSLILWLTIMGLNSRAWKQQAIAA